jgi:CRISPR-associated protein Csy2
LTYGFPAITGFLGATHALNRAIQKDYDVNLTGTLIASHSCEVQSYRPYFNAEYTFNLTRNPIKRDGKTASIVEEGKVNLTATLMIEITAQTPILQKIYQDQDTFTQAIYNQMMRQRLCGGSIHKIDHIEIEISADNLGFKLLPAFVLNDASSDLIDITEQMQASNPEATPLDALIETCTLHHLPPNKDLNKKDWYTETVKKGRGWLVPISVGYQPIAEQMPPDTLSSSRAPEYPSQYVETIFSLGKWEFPARINNIADCFWHYTITDDNLYLVSQSPNLPTTLRGNMPWLQKRKN